MINKKDSLGIYLQEIGRIKLLTAAEEITLARKIADLLKLEQERLSLSKVLKRTPTSLEWARELNISVQQLSHRLHIGRAAKNKMIRANLRLVVSIAKKYSNRGLTLQDLIQEGTLGLIRAAEKFDSELGYKFATYATCWIKQAISRAIANQSRTIRLPIHVTEKIDRVKKITKILTQQIGRIPTEQEIATAMEIDVDKLRFILKAAKPLVSLDKPRGVEEGLNLCDVIPTEAITPEEQVSQNQLWEDLNILLDTLSEREGQVLRLRYGIENGYMKTQDEVGRILNLSKNRIRQIEATALRKLRRPQRTRVLKQYVV